MSVELHQATSNYRNVTGLFCRASWNDDYTTKARALVEAPDWQPPMRLRASLLMEPLILHNAALAGIAPEQVFRPNSYVAEPLAFDEAALTYHGRRHLMTKTFTSLAESGITEVLLVKGAVLAERYDAPALRPMSDIDLILRPDDLTKVASALAQVGWQESPRTWLHPQGYQLDTLSATSDEAQAMWQRAEPIDASPEGLTVLAPNDADHLLYLAGHAIRHAGSRLWQDLADFHLLLDNGRAGHIAQEALALAATSERRVGLAALLMRYNAWGQPLQDLPETLPEFTPSETRQARKLSEQIGMLAVDPMSGTELAALLSLFFPKKTALNRMSDDMGANTKPVAEQTTPRDQLPSNYLQRQLAKLVLLWKVTRQGRLIHYWKLARTVRQLKKHRTFFKAVDPPDFPKNLSEH